MRWRSWHQARVAGAGRFAVALLALACVPGAGTTAEPGIALPSGLRATLQEAIWQDGPVARFRYVAPGLDGAAPLEAVTADMEHLCAADAVARVEAAGLTSVRVMISLADRPSEFGVFDPDVRQVFEAFTVSDGACIWEEF